MHYPGFDHTYSCWCNNGDYHTMPTINFEVTSQDYQYNLEPYDYMFLPYINYTQPETLCILGLMESKRKLHIGSYIIALGQRSMAKFPFYAVYDRVNNRVTVELGAAIDSKSKHEMGF